MLVGHSYIARLNTYLNSELNNLGISPLVATVDCVGLPGATVFPGGKCINTLTSEILGKKPNIVYLQIGENDVANGHSAFLVAEEITHLVKSLTPTVNRVIVGQLLPFPSLERQVIVGTNQELKRRLSTNPNTKFWQHKNGFWKPVTNLLTGLNRTEVFAPDGVHLSQAGQRKYASSVRMAVEKALSSIWFSGHRPGDQEESSTSDLSHCWEAPELVELGMPFEMPDL